MIGSNEMEAFLGEGITRYADASDAVETFEREIQERLLRVLEEKTDWKTFRAKRGPRGRGKALASGVWSGSTGRTIYAYQHSDVENDGWIDLKLWWRSPRDRDRVLLCCGRWDAGYKLRPVELRAPHPRLSAGAVDRSSSHLYARLERIDELEELARALLHEMDGALALHPRP